MALSGASDGAERNGTLGPKSLRTMIPGTATTVLPVIDGSRALTEAQGD
jgi:hypothetical protein